MYEFWSMVLIMMRSRKKQHLGYFFLILVIPYGFHIMHPVLSHIHVLRFCCPFNLGPKTKENLKVKTSIQTKISAWKQQVTQ